ncbi:MAG: phage tail assembly chaperone [Brevundimonas sp.]
MSGRAPGQLLNAPPMPPLARHLWEYFVDLCQTRSSGGMGISRLTRSEIRMWEEDEGVQLERWERRAIILLDAAYCAHASKPEKSNDDEGGDE